MSLWKPISLQIELGLCSAFDWMVAQLIYCSAVFCGSSLIKDNIQNVSK